MYFNHSLAGAVTIKPIIDRYESLFTEKEKTVLWFAGITASVLPDFDLVYAILRNLENHRSFVTHGFFLYFLMFLFLYILSFFQKKEVFGRKFFKVLSLVFITGILTHFLLDFIVGGLVLFAPFSYKVYGFEMALRKLYSNWLLAYLKSEYMILEFVVSIVFFLVIKRKEYFTPKVFALSYFLIAVLSFIFISFIMF